LSVEHARKLALTTAPLCDRAIETSNESPWPEMPLRTVTIDGNRIAYRLAGSGPVLLLVHGLAGSSETWKHVMPALAERFTVVAPDLLGQGESDKPGGDYSLEVHADTLDKLMDTLACGRATVVGQSLGGGVSLQLAYDHPERCERLVLVDSGGLGRELTIYLRLLSLPVLEPIFPIFCSRWLENAGNRIASWLEHSGVHSRPAAQEIWRSYCSLTDAAKRHAFFQSVRGVIDFRGQSVSALDRLHAATQLPTLIVWGAQDPFIPASHAVVAHEAIAGSRIEIFEGVGHYPHCEQPRRFVALLLDFIASTKPAHFAARDAQLLS
jgi:pimeloyl-ACP methyl ester carboxylesterase